MVTTVFIRRNEESRKAIDDTRLYRQKKKKLKGTIPELLKKRKQETHQEMR